MSSVYHQFNKRDQILNHKTHPKCFKRIGTIQFIFFVQHGIKLEIGSRKIAEKPQDTWKLNKSGQGLLENSNIQYMY